MILRMKFFEEIGRCHGLTAQAFHLSCTATPGLEDLVADSSKPSPGVML